MNLSTFTRNLLPDLICTILFCLHICQSALYEIPDSSARVCKGTIRGMRTSDTIKLNSCSGRVFVLFALFFFAIFVFSLSIRDTNTNSSELLYCCPCFVFAPSGQLDYSLVTDLLYSQFYVYPQRFSVDFWWTFILYHRNTLPYDF